jgi:hypothetical protein
VLVVSQLLAAPTRQSFCLPTFAVIAWFVQVLGHTDLIDDFVDDGSPERIDALEVFGAYCS